MMSLSTGYMGHIPPNNTVCAVWRLTDAANGAVGTDESQLVPIGAKMALVSLWLTLN